MASQFIKNRAFIQKLKEPEVMDVDFNLEDSALDYSIESLEEDILPEATYVGSQPWNLLSPSRVYDLLSIFTPLINM